MLGLGNERLDKKNIHGQFTWLPDIKAHNIQKQGEAGHIGSEGIHDGPNPPQSRPPRYRSEWLSHPASLLLRE